MPAQVADWDQVKATAIATGSMIEAADRHGIKYEAVRQRACREQWPVGRRVFEQAKQAQVLAHQAIVKQSGGTVTSVTSAAEALEESLADGSRRTRIGLTRYAARMAEQAAEGGNLEEAPLLKAVADIHSKMHPQANGDQTTVLSFFVAAAPRDTECDSARDMGEVIEVIEVEPAD